MDDLPGLLARDFGFKQQGKAAPMAPRRNSPAGNSSSFPSSAAFGHGFSASDFTRSSSSSRSETNSMPVFEDYDRGPADGLLFNDVFGGPPKYASSESRAPPSSAFDYDNVFKDQKTAKSASIPVDYKPVYDDDTFEGIPVLKSSSVSASAKYEDLFSSISTSPPKHKKQDSSPFDDLLGNFGRTDTEAKKTETAREEKKGIPDFDDVIPGFGRSSSPPSNRSIRESNRSQKSSYDTASAASNVMENPFAVPGSSSTPTVSSSGGFTDPLEEISKLSSSGSRKSDNSSVPGEVLDHLEPLGGLGKSAPEINKGAKDANRSRSGSMNGARSPMEKRESDRLNKAPVDNFMESYKFLFGTASVSVGRSASPPHVNRSPNEANLKANTESRSEENCDASDDVWLTVSEIPLFTQPTSAPPPSRPPPPRPTRPKRSESGSTNAGKTVNELSSFANSTQFYHSPRSARASERSSTTSQMDELEDFATGRAQNTTNEYPEDSSGEDLEANSVAAAAAMKEAMEKAEAKFRHAREMRGREYLKSARGKESCQLESDDFLEKERTEKQERLDLERQQRQREDEERERRRLEKERSEQEEKEIEQRRFEKERTERERELARQAVERATREARERAAAEARAKAQKAAVEKVAAEARERAGRAAVQRAQAEAHERAAAVAREKAEKAAAESRERANAEACARAERAAIERAVAEARTRAAAEARERAAAQARANETKNANDFESIFGMGSRPSSAPRPSTNSSNQRRASESARASSGASSTMWKASTASIADDFSSIFGAAASPSGMFQEVEGESEERRRARLERHQRTQERAAKALAEKNERDLQAQREQAERQRIAETLDVEIKRWTAGKEGNLRALLSTLQYVLWPGCGWQPVSLTDLITAASVKKVYRKATLCIHPDKVQQKGANLQQKYIAEKVFDLLKEAWNKFNSEELF